MLDVSDLYGPQKSESFDEWVREVCEETAKIAEEAIKAGKRAVEDLHYWDLSNHIGEEPVILVKQAQYFVLKPFAVQQAIRQSSLESFRAALEGFVETLKSEDPRLSDEEIGRHIANFIEPINGFYMKKLRYSLLIVNREAKNYLRAYDPSFNIPEL